MSPVSLSLQFVREHISVLARMIRLIVEVILSHWGRGSRERSAQCMPILFYGLEARVLNKSGLWTLY